MSTNVVSDTPVERIPIVSYLVLAEGDAHLVATECCECGARYLGERMACAQCGRRTFRARRLPSRGTVGSFTIIHRAAKGVRTPFVSALVDLDDGTTIKCSIVGCEPDPAVVRLGMPVQLTTFHAGVDDNGTVAIGFAFEPSLAATRTEGAAR